MQVRIIKKSVYEYTKELFLNFFIQTRVSDNDEWTDIWFEPHYDDSKKEWFFTFDEESSKKCRYHLGKRVCASNFETAKDILNQYKRFLKRKKKEELKKIQEAEIRRAESKRAEEERLKRKDEIIAYKEVFYEETIII